MDRAAAGTLERADVPGLVTELMAEPGFEEQLHDFLHQWLEVDHFETTEKSEVYPGFLQAKPHMENEIAAFFEQSGRPDSGLSELLLDPVPSVSPALTTFYYSDPSAPAQGERLGVLGLGAVLASHAKTYLTSPTLRGTFVRKRFFCQEITLPEGFTPPPISDTEARGVAKSTRELYEQHLTDPSCNACHRLTDNIGFSLESFDGAGRFRTEDSTQGPPVPLDMSTELTDSDVNRPLSGPVDLSRALSESEEVKECFARQAFRFFFGQAEEKEEKLPAILVARDHLVASDTIEELILGLFSTQNTEHRGREAN